MGGAGERGQVDLLYRRHFSPQSMLLDVVCVAGRQKEVAIRQLICKGEERERAMGKWFDASFDLESVVDLMETLELTGSLRCLGV